MVSFVLKFRCLFVPAGRSSRPCANLRARVNPQELTRAGHRTYAAGRRLLPAADGSIEYEVAD